MSLRSSRARSSGGCRYTENNPSAQCVKERNIFSINVFIYNGDVLNAEGRRGPLMTNYARTKHKTHLNVSTSRLLVIACIMSTVAHNTTTSITFLQAPLLQPLGQTLAHLIRFILLTGK